MTLDAEVFLDAAYLVALGQLGDEFHMRAIMQKRGIRQALTTDEHFEQAGFTALLADQD